jgi:CBS domain containing-hemolysin-like protein
MFALITYALVAILISFLCSVMEAVLLSITPSYVAGLQKTQLNLAKQVKALKDKVDQPLAAILSLNTVAHTAGAAGVGAQAAQLYGDTAIGIASAIMTILVLVFSEIIPKTIGAMYWRQLTSVVVFILSWLVRILKPFIWLSDLITKMFSAKQDESKYIRQEIEAMAEIGSEVGALKQGESDIIQSLLRFRHVKLRSIMTPRNQVFKLHKDVTVEEYSKNYGSVSYSRILVFDKDSDDIIGFVLKSDVLLANSRIRPDYKISKLVKPIFTVSEKLPLPKLFNFLLEKRAHISLVIDEYGDIQGIVTLEDVIESLLKIDILDERDRVE